MFTAPLKLFRYGDTCTWFKSTHKAEDVLTMWTWTYSNPIPAAFDVHRVSWQVFSESSRDLDQVLWQAHLRWHLPVADVMIGPLTQHAGSIGDRLFPKDRGNLERLADVSASLPSEEMWRILTQGSREGGVYRFDGEKDYTEHAIFLPANTQVDIQMLFDAPVVLERELRVRVILHGVYKNVVEVA